MGYEIPTERIELENDQWWEIYTIVTRGMRKAFRTAGLQTVAGAFKDNGKAFNMQDAEALQAVVLAHPDQIDLDAVDDAFLIHGTKACSFGKQVTRVMLDGLPEGLVQPVLDRLRELYAETTEEARKNLSGTP